MKIVRNGQEYCNNLFQDYLSDPDIFLQSILDKLMSHLFQSSNN